MACPSTCENPPESTGARGVCDNVTGLCICPPGFDGKDIWREFNDCHIDQAMRSNFLLATFVLNVIALTLSILVLSRLLYHYLRSLPGRGGICCRSEAAPFDDLVAVEAMKGEETLKVRRAQKRRIIAQVTLQMTGALSLLPYSVSILFFSPSVFRYEQPYFLDACLALFHTAVFSTYWMSTYVWFKLLPSLPFIAKLYKLKSFVFDKPNLVPRVAMANVTAVVLLEFLFTFLLPTIYFGDAELRDIFDTVAVVCRMLFCLSLCIPVFLYLRAFRSLLDQSVYQQKSLEQLELKFIGKGKISLRVIRTSLVLLITMWIIVFIPALATEYGMRNRYAFYSPAVCAALIVVIISIINTGIRMAETVDLASSVRPVREGEQQTRNKISFSQVSGRALRELLMDDDEVNKDEV